MIVSLSPAFSALNRFRIPTLLGLLIIFLGTGAGVFLISQQQMLSTQATLDPPPQEILITNVQDESVTVTWKTSDPSPGFVKYGQNSTDFTALDNSSEIQPKFFHSVTIKRLTPKTTYQFQISSGKTVFEEVHTFTTTASSTNNNPLNPLIGTVIFNNQPVTNGTAFLTINGAFTQSAPISKLGNFTIPLSKVYKDDRSEILTLTDATLGQLKIVSPHGTANATLFLSQLEKPIGPLKIGESLDLTLLPQIESLQSDEQQEEDEEINFDLNDDGYVNAADETLVKRNFGTNPKDPRADFTGDSIVDGEDLELFREQLKQNNNTR